MGECRIRRVISRSKTTGSGKYPSWKMKRMLHWEAVGELNAFRILDTDAKVETFQEQPLEISYLMDGVVHTHVPDIKVSLWTAQQELWEIKTKADAASNEVQRRTALMVSNLPTVGFTYRLIVDEDLAASVRLKNALTVLRFGRSEIAPLEREKWRRLLAQMPQLSWRDLLSGAIGAKGRAFACRLILEAKLQVDLDVPLLPAAVSRPLAKPSDFFATNADGHI